MKADFFNVTEVDENGDVDLLSWDGSPDAEGLNVRDIIFKNYYYTVRKNKYY